MHAGDSRTDDQDLPGEGSKEQESSYQGLIAKPRERVQERVLEEKVVKRLCVTARTRADLVRHDHLRNAAGREP
jgi:hypothetical protein